MAHTGLYFGSFNPIHNGHLIVAQYMLNTGVFDNIRFVVSPQNPFKKQADLMDQNLRLEMVRAAVQDNPELNVSDAEFHLPVPSYTIQTLRFFNQTEPNEKFSIIMGSDNLPKLKDWKEIESIANICDFHVYRRRGFETAESSVIARFSMYEAPFLDISATYIRQQLQQQKSVKYLIPDPALSVLQSSGYFD